MPDTELLTDQQIAEIADMFPHTEYQPTLSPDEVDSCEFCKGTIDDHKANCVVPHVHTLIATVKQLRDENGDLRSEMSAFKKDREESELGYMRQVESVEKAVARVAAERDDLQSQLEQLRAENERLTKERNEARQQLKDLEAEYL